LRRFQSSSGPRIRFEFLCSLVDYLFFLMQDQLLNPFLAHLTFSLLGRANFVLFFLKDPFLDRREKCRSEVSFIVYACIIIYYRTIGLLVPIHGQQRVLLISKMKRRCRIPYDRDVPHRTDRRVNIIWLDYSKYELNFAVSCPDLTMCTGSSNVRGSFFE
jgi:hypothetical protein